MKRLTLIPIFYFFIVTNALTNENYIFLQNFNKISDNKIIFMRHALAPGNGDPSNFKIDDCSTQRNLDTNGIRQSQIIGESFKRFGIRFTKIFSSFWCRCIDTAMNMEVGEFKTHVGLNSFYEKHADRETTLKKLNNLIKSFNKLDGPYLLVTHYVNILAFTGLSTSSGGMVAYDLNTKVSTYIKTNN